MRVESTGAHEAVVRHQGSGFFVGHVSPVAWRAEMHVKRGAGEIASVTTGLAERTRPRREGPARLIRETLSTG